MNNRIVRIFAIIFGLSLLAVPGILFGKQIIETFVTPTKTMYSGESDDVDMDMPKGNENSISKEEYIRERDEQIALIRGFPLVNGDERIKAIRTMESQEKVYGRAAGPALANWHYLGPSPIPVSVPTSGRVSCIAVHPTNPDIAYVGTAQGGLYRTLNGGTTWTPLLDNALSLAIGSVAIAPSDPTTVYVGTGETSSSLDSFLGVGIYRITNADTTPVVSAPIGSAEFNGRSIARILVHPNDANMIFVASSTGSCGLGGCSGAPSPLLGVYRSSNALSASPTFTKLNVTAAGGGNRAVSDIVMEPGVPDNIICWVKGSAGAGDGGIYRSTNATTASPTFTQTYTMVTSGSRGQLAIQKTGSVVTVVAATGEVAGGSTQGAVFKSSDGGATFPTQLTAGNNFCDPQCFYDIAVAFDPTNANTIYLAGSPSAVFNRSLNGGVTFTSSSGGLHVDTHAITVAPSNPQIIYYGSDGGVYRSVNGGTNWSSLNNSTIAATQFQSLAVHPALANYSLGGTQDNGTEFLANDGTTWINSDGGDGGNVVIDQTATTATNVVSYHTYFNSTTASQIGFVRATSTVSSGDPNWSVFLGCGGTANGISCSDSTLFYAPMVGGPGNPNTLYFGTNFLYRSTNQGTTMTAVSQSMSSTISAISISRQNDNVRLIGLSNGTVWATSTGSSTLTQMTGSFPGRYVGRTAIDPSNANIAYVTFNGYGVAAGAHVFKTTNLSAPTPTWSAAGNGIPDVPVNAFAIDPTNSNNVYAGTDIGVYGSSDGGANWVPMNNGQLPRVAVFDMAIQPTSKTLRIATHGRGIWDYSLTATRRTAFDYDGDGKADVSVFRPSNSIWYLNRSQAGFGAYQFGSTGDIPTPADFTGDGKTDVAVFRPSMGTWFVLRSEDSTFYAAGFGTSGDIPVQGDYDGDGKADLAVYRPSQGTWYIQRSTAGFTAMQFGISTDLPSIGDFDGDGKNDIAVYRPATGIWYRVNSSNGSFTGVQFGAAGDKIVPADYTGDGKTDVAVWRPTTGAWYVLRSEDNSFYGTSFGTLGDLPAPADYDGDGKADIAVYRPTQGIWYLQQSTSGFAAAQFGVSEDKPTPNSIVF